MKRQLEIHTHFANGQPTRWPEMIACCLQNELKLSDWDFEGFEKMPFVDMKFYWSELCLKKCHNIVPADFQCDPGDAIEFLAVTPDGDEFKFAPLVKCRGIGKLKLYRDPYSGVKMIKIENEIGETDILNLPTSIRFIEECGYSSQRFFDEMRSCDDSMKIIYWTDKRY